MSLTLRCAVIGAAAILLVWAVPWLMMPYRSHKTAEWLQVLAEHPDPNERLRAVRYLNEFGVKSPSILPTLIKALGDESPSVRREVAYLISICGPEAQRAVPALARLLDDPDPFVRACAAGVLGTVSGDEGPSVLPSLRRAAADPDEWVRRAAAKAIDRIERRIHGQSRGEERGHH